jgi:hypothetical protein
VPHVTEICLFGAAFVVAYSYGPGWFGLLRKLVTRSRRS